MKRKNSQEPGKTEDRAQLILIGGLVIAVAVVAIALVVGGGLFSQSTNDDGGLSSFTSQTADQIQAAEFVGEKSLNYSNVNATLLQGAYPDQLCGKLVESAQIQQLVSTQLGEGESVVDIGVVNQDCGNSTLEGASWVVGQTNTSYQLPSVNSTSAGGTQTVTCEDLNEDTNFDDGNVQSEWADQIVANNGGTVPQPVDVDGADKLEALEDVESSNSTTLTLDPIRAFSGLALLEYAKQCTSYNVTGERLPADVVFAIDTTGSMDSSTRVTKAWQTPPHGGTFPSEDLTSTHRSDTGVTIPGDWIDVRCSTTISCVWSGGTSGEIVYDNDANRFAKIDSNSPTTVCGFFSCYDAWDVEYQDGSTAQVPETDLYNADYRLDAPERMWFTQKGLKNSLGDLNSTVPDRAGLLEYDADIYSSCTACPTTEHAGVVGINDSTHREVIKETVDTFMPGGNTDISGATVASKDVLNDDYGTGPGSSTDATKNIVLMTDGQYTAGEHPEEYIQDNKDEYEDIYIHSIVLGEDAADNEDAVEDMAALANDPDPDLSNSDVDESDLPSRDPDRPNGTLVASDDPSDAEGIFEDIVGSIQAAADSDDDANAGTSNPNASFSTSPTANTGSVQDIKDVRMNVSDFQGNGTYIVNFEGDEDNDGNNELIWGIEVDNKFVNPGPFSSSGYEVRFRSQTLGSLNQTVTVPDTEGNLSDSDNYVWFDLTGSDPVKPRFDVGASVSSPDSYVSDGWTEVQKELGSGPTSGVDIVVQHRGPNGPNAPPLRRGTVKGAFSMEFEPKDGDFEDIGQMTGGNFTDDCDAANATNLPSRCGLNDPGNNRSAVATTQIDEIELEVTVNSPDGQSKKRVTIPPGNEEFDLDIFDPNQNNLNINP